MPIAEQEAEGIHRDVSQEKKRAIGSKLPWLAATVKLKENLDFYDKHVRDSADMSKRFEWEWKNFRRIGQHRLGLQHRAARMSFKSVCRFSYAMVHPGMEEPWPVAAKATDSMSVTDITYWRAEYLAATIQVGEIYSVPAPDGMNPDKRNFFQVIHLLSSSVKLIRDPLSMRMGLPALVQQYGEWAPRGVQADRADVFTVDSGQSIDLVAFAPWKAFRHELRRWQRSPSDVHHCVQLTDPVLAEPVLGPGGLLEPDVPFVLIAEQMAAMGWQKKRKGARAPPHRPADAVRLFSRSDARHRKPYFQALLALPGCESKAFKSH